MVLSSPHELRREAAILLLRLGKNRGYVIRSERDGTWQVYTAKNRYGRAVASTSDDIIQLLRREGEIAERPGGGFIPVAGIHGAPLTEIVEGGGASGQILRNEAEWALGWLRSRRDADGNPMIGDEQFAAAETLRRDYTVACLEPRVTQSWDQPVSSPRQSRGAGPHDGGVSEKALLAKKRLFAALNVVGPELAGILLEICCLTAGIEQAERTLGLPERSGRPILQLALTRLARHYGLLPRSEVQIQKAVRHWGREGYRPDL